ncbi:MAG TPA: peptide ABC transporter ATP-binding protein [Synergistaceae bacterium]|jgi:oligopeptide/dipeptide ABC transporter ATP-binding protein|nr:MAG: Oligopeptide/dipeptide ABC transporter, ATPase subunit [Synergistales bacterium 53_16]MDK2846594.1 peptide/nickel transport system ATP-binding protein [Synergistales bacterium]MDN5336751.1 peptide/nickel transport system ATP-binding protein [Synergistales bacterium]HAA46931.1 peptide ABC transporter ATP-binding protein [Synergistaceae bacterium]HAG22370.1 peptide ABC transporter ATP-binding protein [Synergistaceae bacterium]
MAETLLEIKDLYVNFYTYRGIVRAINGVSFTVEKGEFFGLVGETGCGKSVTASAVLNLIRNPGRIESGQVVFKGRDLLSLPADTFRSEIRGKEITMIMQHPVAALNPVMRVGEQIAEVFPGKGDKTAIVVEKLREVNIPEPEKIALSYPHQLSGGMAQRVMIAMMLAPKPSLLIADEPTTALDVSVQAQVLKLLKELVARHRSSVLLITHDMSVVAETCDRVGVMYAGDIVETGSVEEVIFNPLHPYTKGLMAAIPSEDKKKLEGIPGVVPELVSPPPGCRFHPRCPRLMDICSSVKPSFHEAGKAHRVACHLY